MRYGVLGGGRRKASEKRMTSAQRSVVVPAFKKYKSKSGGKNYATKNVAADVLRKRFKL